MKIEEIKEWFDTAESDFYSAQILDKAHPKPCEHICYHCTQAAEKYLKGFLIYNDIAFNYNHNLSELINDCINVNPEFNILIQKCDILNKFSVSNLRYPPKLNVNEEHVKICINIVKDIEKFEPIMKIINETKINV